MPSARLFVRVIPRSPRTRVDGMRGDAVLVRLKAPPVEGAANDALLAFLSDALDLPRRSIRIVSGLKSRDKIVEVEGMTIDAVLQSLTGSRAHGGTGSRGHEDQ